MADITATDILHDMKGSKKSALHREHHDVSSNASNHEKSQQDIERTASHGAGYDLSNIPIEDGEYVVTAKTWAVVVVLALSYGMCCLKVLNPKLIVLTYSL